MAFRFISWKGLNSFQHSLRDLTPRPFHFTHYSRKNEEGVPLKTTHSLTLSPLPQFQEMSAKARGRKIKSLLYSRLQEYWEKRGDTPYLSTELIEQQIPGSVPKRVSRSPRPLRSLSIFFASRYPQAVKVGKVKS
jgi:hypothetical protein